MPRPVKGSPEAKAQAAKMRAAKPKAQKRTETKAAYSSYEADDIAELKRQIAELKEMQSRPQVTAQGIVGTYEKHSVDPADYPDPRERLSAEQRLATIAFPFNYELEWDIKVSSYDTIDGRRIREPKFHLNLVGIRKDEDGVDTGKRYYIRKSVFHEDPDAAMIIAREQGLPVDESNPKGFLDEMRYIRMRDWIFDIFWPKASTSTGAIREEVIGNTMVQVFEKSSEETSDIPFDQITKKL